MMANRNSFFEQLKKQMLDKGVDFEQTGNKSEKKSTLLQALATQVQRHEPGPGPLAHGDHASFPRFSRMAEISLEASDFSTKEKTAEEESPRKADLNI